MDAGGEGLIAYRAHSHLTFCHRQSHKSARTDGIEESEHALPIACGPIVPGLTIDY